GKSLKVGLVASRAQCRKLNLTTFSDSNGRPKERAQTNLPQTVGPIPNAASDRIRDFCGNFLTCEAPPPIRACQLEVGGSRILTHCGRARSLLLFTILTPFLVLALVKICPRFVVT